MANITRTLYARLIQTEKEGVIVGNVPTQVTAGEIVFGTGTAQINFADNSHLLREVMYLTFDEPTEDELELMVEYSGFEFPVFISTFLIEDDEAEPYEIPLEFVERELVETATEGDDAITLTDLSEFLRAGAGNDVIDGGRGRDLIEGDRGVDTLSGGNGDDFIRGGAGKDLIDGGKGQDIISGGGGDDTINGGRDRDKLFGDNGDDVLTGERGRDKIRAGEGDDVLRGGKGDDLLIGSGGADTYIFVTGHGDDEISERRNGGGDRDRDAIKDIIEFRNVSDLDTLTLTRVNDDLLIDYNGGLDSITVDRYFDSPRWQIETIRGSTGDEIDLTQPSDDWLS